jgi:hypothetical protein
MILYINSRKDGHNNEAIAFKSVLFISLYSKFKLQKGST